MDQTEALPEDALAGILGRLPPRDLAVCRCVRKAWRPIVDSSGLLLPHVVPLTLRGLFLNYSNRTSPRFFVHPASTRQPAVDGDLSFLSNYGSGSRRIVDHCNGLLLYRDLGRLSIVNPSTSRWEDLSWKDDDGCHDACLVFDPAVSVHYEVFSVRLEPGRVIENPAKPDLIECPPSSWTLNVFSSSTRQWQKRLFVREAKAPKTVTNVQQLDSAEQRSMWCPGSVYWRGSLYLLHCCGLFVVRLSLSDRKYRVIKTPINIDECKQARPYIGKSEKGVYFASMHDSFRLQVWTLMESSEWVDWASKNIIDLKACATVKSHESHNMEGTLKTWILDGGDGNNAKTMIEKLDWDSDDDSIVNIEDAYEGICNEIRFLGFHPYKEVIFLGLTSSQGGVGVACHLNSSKFQYLGILSQHTYWLGIQGSFPYTPCISGHLLKSFRE
ncbi:hypothetical protein VPH35_120784 [Triticum aestivum]